MGLDYSFFKQDTTEVLSFRQHIDLFEMLVSEPLVCIEPYSDFYVTRPMITSLIEKIEDEMRDCGLSVPDLPASDDLKRLCAAVPMQFFWSDPDDWQSALPTYRLLLTDLLSEVMKEGCLICGCSA